MKGSSREKARRNTEGSWNNKTREEYYYKEERKGEAEGED